MLVLRWHLTDSLVAATWDPAAVDPAEARRAVDAVLAAAGRA